MSKTGVAGWFLETVDCFDRLFNYIHSLVLRLGIQWRTIVLVTTNNLIDNNE